MVIVDRYIVEHQPWLAPNTITHTLMSDRHTVEGRIRTFTAQKTSKPTWPHAAALNPSAMAMAGWYHRPSASSPDNVACFLCGKNLDGWQPEKDDAWMEHVAHGKHCPLVRLDLVENRERTFEHWPHSKPSRQQVQLLHVDIVDGISWILLLPKRGKR